MEHNFIRSSHHLSVSRISRDSLQQCVCVWGGEKAFYFKGDEPAMP